MTSLLDRFTGTAEPEGGTVTQPYRPGERPFWLGIPGLDLAVPAPADRDFAARLAAEACATYVHGMTATMARPLVSWGRKNAAEVYLAWLLKAGSDDLDAWTRRYCLRVTCDRVGPDGDVAPGAVLEAADLAADFLYPGRRR